jgi:TonB family protein
MLLRICLVLLLVAPAISLAGGPDGSGDGKPQITKHVRPVYPPEAKQAGIQGKVELEAVVSRDGTVRSVNVLNGEPVLADAATAAVKQWEYQPVLHDGEPVEVITRITVNFVLAK